MIAGFFVCFKGETIPFFWLGFAKTRKLAGYGDY